jgi:hypothetical protein
MLTEKGEHRRQNGTRGPESLLKRHESWVLALAGFVQAIGPAQRPDIRAWWRLSGAPGPFCAFRGVHH